MKKIITSASLVALGAASVQAAYTPSMEAGDSAKPWSVSASLRGFYDDNYTTSPKPFARESFGVELSPAADLNLRPTEQTYIGLSYAYSMRWYEDRKQNSADHSHQANAKLSHAFSERYQLDLSDSFVIAQEPQVLDPSAVVTTPLRSNGNNIRNTGSATVTAAWTELFSTVLGYSNTFYDYDQTGPASRSALLDRMEHLITINGRWQALPQTVAVLGYQYGMIDYTSKNSLNFFTYVNPDVRDNKSHYAYVGVDQGIAQNLNASVRVGAQITDYDNPVPGSTQDTVNPYVDANATWTYMKDSYLQLGVRHSRSQTDVAFFGASAVPTLDAETTTVYGSLNHQILPKLTGSVLGQAQFSSFESGAADNLSDYFFLVGVNLAYEINKFLVAETGYNYDRLDSDLAGRSYTRNRIYIGLRARY